MIGYLTKYIYTLVSLHTFFSFRHLIGTSTLIEVLLTLGHASKDRKALVSSEVSRQWILRISERPPEASLNKFRISRLVKQIIRNPYYVMFRKEAL